MRLDSALRIPLAAGGSPVADDRHPRSVVVIVNPSKVAPARAVQEVRDQVRPLGWAAPRVLETTIDEPGCPQAQMAVRDGADLVVVVGGDGTVREVALGLSGSGVPLGIVPAGTANIVARNLGIIPRALRENVTHALLGDRLGMDVGRARFRQTHGGRQWSSEHLFLVLAGIGHDAATVADTREWLKARAGWLAYAESGVRHALARPVPMRVRLDDGPSREVRAWSVLAGNCGAVPPRVQVFPGALLDDGRLEVLEVTVRRPDQWLPVAVKGLLGLRREVPGLRYTGARTLTVTTPVGQPVQLDGDTYPDVVELRVEVERHGVQVKIPSLGGPWRCPEQAD